MIKKNNSHCSMHRRAAGKFFTGARALPFVLFLIFPLYFAYAQNIEASRLATIRYGTDAEIASLIQTLKTENAEYLDNELALLIETTRNQRILTGIFSFFGDRGKSGLEQRAIRVIEERDDEANETVLSAVDYLGKVKASDAVSCLMELLDSQERRFLNAAFRAIGRAASGDRAAADETAEYLVDYYTNGTPGDDNLRDIIISIGLTESAKGVQFLIGIAGNSDERMALRIASIEALAKIADPSGLPVILESVGASDPNVRSAAVASLGPFSGDDVDKAILDAFRDSYYRTRIAACQASRDRRLAAAVPFLQYRAERDEVANVKDEAIRALGAIANEEAIQAMETFFTERRTPDRIRILSAEMLMKNAPDKYLGRLIAELDEAKLRNQTALYNGLLKVAGETVITGEAGELLAGLARRFMQNGGVIEKLYGLDMAANNGLVGLSQEIIKLIDERNEAISRRARGAAEKLGIEI
jgi:HEAT repeat protein